MKETPPISKAPASGGIPDLVEHLFRRESGKMVAVLTGIFGAEHLTLAEDVVQEALARALQSWPFRGVPENPAAWLMRAARNLALDVVRRQKVFRDKEPEIIRIMDRETPPLEAAADQEIADDRLRMMFVCCHPAIPEDAQAALALKTLCGFGVGEIARAFLSSEAAIAKRLTRAKQEIRDARIPFEIPTGPELATRLDGVLRTLYLLFNEGYKASSGDRLVRQELCDEAVRLTELLIRLPGSHHPRTHALLALMLMNAARFPTRTDDAGNLLRLEDQDRSRWDRALLGRGLFHFTQSGSGEKLTAYHLQAAIAVCHCAAADFASTDWARILELYDELLSFDGSPVVALNRAVALSKVRGPQAGIEAVGEIKNLQSLESYYLLHAVLGELESQLHHPHAAAVHFRRSLQLAEIKSEQDFLTGRLQTCEAAAAGARVRD